MTLTITQKDIGESQSTKAEPEGTSLEQGIPSRNGHDTISCDDCSARHDDHCCGVNTLNRQLPCFVNTYDYDALE